MTNFYLGQCLDRQRIAHFNLYNYVNLNNLEWNNLSTDLNYIGFTNIQKVILDILNSYISTKLYDLIFFDNLSEIDRNIVITNISELILPIPFTKIQTNENNGISIVINIKKLWLIPTIRESEHIIPIFDANVENYYDNLVNTYCINLNTLDNEHSFYHIKYCIYNKLPVPYSIYLSYIKYIAQLYSLHYNLNYNISLIFREMNKYHGYKNFRNNYSKYVFMYNNLYDIISNIDPTVRAQGEADSIAENNRNIFNNDITYFENNNSDIVVEESESISNHCIRMKLSDLIFDIKSKLTDYEYINILDTIAKITV